LLAACITLSGMETVLDANLWVAFFMLTALEIVLGVDNLVFLSILVGRLPEQVRDRARRLGLLFAMGTRLALLFSLSWVMDLKEDLFTVLGEGFSGRDLVLLGGGVFLLYKASREIFTEVEAREEQAQQRASMESRRAKAQFWAVIGQIALIDIVFSLDSVITAVGMVDHLPVMIAAVVTSVILMMVAAKPIGDFVQRHPSVKVLALSFLVMVGMALSAEAFGFHVPKGYIYAAMAFSLGVEMLNIRAQKKRRALQAV
jgi:predicted tellurium resistance membrane protein TerC